VSEHDFIIFATLWNLKTPHTKSLSENPCPDLRTSHSYKKHVFLFQNTGWNVFKKIMSSFGNNVIVAQLNIHSPFFKSNTTKFCLSHFQTVETATFFSHWPWCSIAFKTCGYFYCKFRVIDHHSRLRTRDGQVSSICLPDSFELSK